MRTTCMDAHLCAHLWNNTRRVPASLSHTHPPTRTHKRQLCVCASCCPTLLQRARASSSGSNALTDGASRSASFGIDESSPHTASDDEHSADGSERDSTSQQLNGDGKRASYTAVQRRRLQVREASRRFRERKKQVCYAGGQARPQSHTVFCTRTGIHFYAHVHACTEHCRK